MAELAAIYNVIRRLEEQSVPNSSGAQNKSSGKLDNEKADIKHRDKLDVEALEILAEYDALSLKQLNTLLRQLRHQEALARDEILAQHKAKQDTWDAIQKHRKLASLIDNVEGRISNSWSSFIVSWVNATPS